MTETHGTCTNGVLALILCLPCWPRQNMAHLLNKRDPRVVFQSLKWVTAVPVTSNTHSSAHYTSARAVPHSPLHCPCLTCLPNLACHSRVQEVSSVRQWWLYRFVFLLTSSLQIPPLIRYDGFMQPTGHVNPLHRPWHSQPPQASAWVLAPLEGPSPFPHRISWKRTTQQSRLAVQGVGFLSWSQTLLTCWLSQTVLRPELSSWDNTVTTAQAQAERAMLSIRLWDPLEKHRKHWSAFLLSWPVL